MIKDPAKQKKKSKKAEAKEKQALDNALAKKQTEVNKVIQAKMKILSTDKLSYLEYIELKEDIYRLTNFRNGIDKKILEAKF